MPKRARGTYKKKFVKRKRRFNKKRVPLRKKIQRVVERNIETKLSTLKVEGTLEGGSIALLHNNITLVDGNLIHTTQGVQNPQVNQLTNRVGDIIHVKGIRLQFHLQLDPHQSQCQFKIFVVKSAKGDIPNNGTSSTLFVNLTGNNMMDYVNKRRYKIIKQKMVTILQQGFGTVGAVPLLEAFSGQVSAIPADLRITPASKIVSLNLRGTSFGRAGKVTYTPEGSNVSVFYDYSVHILAYNSIIKADVGTVSGS